MKKLLFFCLIFTSLNQVYGARRITVAQDGSGNYKTVQEAVNAVKNNDAERTEIFVKKGTYKERIIVGLNKINISLIGEDVKNTVLVFDNYALRLDSAGVALGTARTASFYVYGSGFTAKNITFQNSAGPVGQALAIYIAGDRAAFFGCRFLGFQDTIYTNGHGAREYYQDCYIEGTTDFIFGAATALFDHCTIFCKKGGLYISAASTLDTTQYGYVFMHCTVTGNAPDGTFALGRPWRAYAKVVYLYCELGRVIMDAGWDNWRNAENEKTAYYAEYKNTGPGYRPDKRVAWSHQLNDKEARLYTKQQILNDWNPD
ncbi:pectinesterase family protein [Mucilaginibacter paludis]|uniref:Pectinesterase n=1 Tax=Mucilaginibacter paludis DSM 18603 TaxID=714943 RepID=H1YEL9_9SPHI|nr:pectinesterase family protein [Mucilaginibacter paludis]EHQ30779.1 Pectinesterase [Mucilaginibacter paludis DSM 18603]